MRFVVRAGTVFIALLAQVGFAFAAFEASDLLYLPAAAHNEGVSGSLWRTDLTVTNVDTTPIDVCIFFFPTGLYSNAAFLSRTYGLGGRSSEGWGHVNEALAAIPPMGSVVLPDVVGEYWLEQFTANTALGGMVIFAYEAGTLDAPDGRVFRNAVAASRTYNATTIWVPDTANEGQYIQEDATFGQSVHGVPWYDLADPSFVSEQGDFSYYVATGGVDTDVYRYNVGLFNCSDSQTSVTLRIAPFKADGTAFTGETGDPLTRLIIMPPLSHIQYNRILYTMFSLSDVTGVTLKVSFVAWSTTSPDPNPAFTLYGSVIDSRTNDPTTVVPSFAFPYNVDCMWPSPTPTPGPGRGKTSAAPAPTPTPGPGRGKASTPTPSRHRPLDIPRR
jgi:hypothetical protein